MRLDRVRTKVNSLLRDREHAVRQVQEEKNALDKAERLLLATTEAQHLIQAVAQSVQRRAHKKIASIVSHCLEAVFQEPYKFEIVFERKRGRTEARLIFKRGELEVDPLTASGGGVVDIAAFALRLACLTLSQPRGRRLLVLDEPFRFVSAEYRPRVVDLLEALSTDLDVQFILVTHSPDFQIGKVVKLCTTQ